MTYPDCKKDGSHSIGSLFPFIKYGKDLFQKKQVKLAARYTVFLSILIYLAFKLSSIGWGNIVQSLPSSFAFYLLSIAFVSLPILIDRFAFQNIAEGKTSPSLKVFIRKHVINETLMKYAGEAYFIQHLSSLKGYDLRSAAITIKNLALVRTFVANFWIILLVLGAVLLGKSDALNEIVRVSPALVAAVSVLSLGICLGSIVFFRKITRLEFNLAKKIVSIYLLRSFLAASILVAQWSIALPGTSIAVWFQFLIVYSVSKKSPVGGALVFVSVALTLPGLGGGNAAVAAMLLTMTAISQMLYFLGFIMTSDLLRPVRAQYRQKKSKNHLEVC